MKLINDLTDVRNRLKGKLNPTRLDEAMGLIEKIRQLKEEKNVVVLGHNYMSPEVYYGVSDFVGDSLALAREAVSVEADIILFNGVYFMAETAKIMNPSKMVLIADDRAGCSLVENITADDVVSLKEKYPGAPVVTYVNSSAEVKAESDICCTSANAVKVVNSLKEDRVIFIPDAYLGSNVAKETDKQIITWENGKCMVHELFTPQEIDDLRHEFDNLLVIAHPECSKDVTEVADFSGSTSQMADFIRHADNTNVFLATECGMSDNLRSEFPDRKLIGTCQICPHMKLITLEKILHSLETETVQVFVEEKLRIRARHAVDRMIEIG